MTTASAFTGTIQSDTGPNLPFPEPPQWRIKWRITRGEEVAADFKWRLHYIREAIANAINREIVAARIDQREKDVAAFRKNYIFAGDMARWLSELPIGE